MKDFNAYFRLELKRILFSKKIIVYLLIILISLYFVQNGIFKYKKGEENKAQFQELEIKNVQKLINYTQYGLYGFRIFFRVSPLSILFKNTGIIDEMTAFIDSGIRLRINKSYLGENLFSEKSKDFNDFSMFIYLFISVFMLYWGYDSLKHLDFLKTLSSISNYERVHRILIGVKSLVFFLLLILIFVILLLQMIINNIHLSANEYLKLICFIIVITISSFIFLLIGTNAGNPKSKSTGIVTMISAWFFLMIFIPLLITNIISNKSNNMSSDYDIEQKKLNILMDFEKKAKDEAQRYTSMYERTLSERKLIEEYWEHELNKIKSKEKKMQMEMIENYKYFKLLSSIFTTTFYNLINIEISSKGYENFFEFYEYCQELQIGFIRYYFNKKFYSNYSKVESYIKGDQNIYYAESRLPDTFLFGAAINLFWVVLLYWISLIRFKKAIFRIDAAQVPRVNLENSKVKLNKGQYKIFGIEGSFFMNWLYNLFSGRIPKLTTNRLKLLYLNIIHKIKKDAGPPAEKVFKEPEILLNGSEYSPTGKRLDFVFICSPESLPGDLKVGDFFKYITTITRCGGDLKAKIHADLNMDEIKNKRIKQLKKRDKAMLLMALSRMKPADIYLFHNTVRGMSRKIALEFKDHMDELSQKGEIPLYLASDLIPNQSEELEESGFVDQTKNWSNMIETGRY